MRKKIVAGNWKMNLSLADALNLTDNLVTFLQATSLHKTDVIIAPAFTFLHPVAGRINNKMNLAAQNCSEYDNGAYTGDISTSMLKDCAVTHVIVGHSERRKYHFESDEVINLKLKKVISDRLIPILCIGETIEEREQNKHFEVIKMQINKALLEVRLTDANKLVIAYEPVWAIGTGKTATPQQAQEMHAFIRNELKTLYNESFAQSIHILYGGSCNAANAFELFTCKDIDGGLIGGASLKADEFIKIIEAAEKS